MRFSIVARSVISGSRAAFSITVSPLASTAAVSRFSVAPTLGNSRTTRAPDRRLVRASMKPWTTESSTPIDSSPRKCMSSLRLPMLSPPGMATRASPQRASNGPSTLIDARIRVTSSYGASACSGALASMRSSAGPVHSTPAPMARSTSIITSRSATGSRLRNVVTPGASSAAAICLVPAFLVAPAMRTEPCSGQPARTTRESVIAPSLREAQREVVLELGRARHPPDRDRGDDPGDRALAQRHDGEAVAQRGGDLVVGEDLARPGGVARAATRG